MDCGSTIWLERGAVILARESSGLGCCTFRNNYPKLTPDIDGLRIMGTDSGQRIMGTDLTDGNGL